MNPASESDRASIPVSPQGRVWAVLDCVMCPDGDTSYPAVLVYRGDSLCRAHFAFVKERA